MKFVSLIFDYDLDKMVRSGRIWAKQGYTGKEHILEYSAASIATVLHHNPNVQYDVWTDSPRALSSALDEYDVSKRSLNILDKSSEIRAFKEHEYCFWPAVMFFDECVKSADDTVVKLDNDLTCLRPCDELFEHPDALVWRFERSCARGRDYWGESYAAQRAFGRTDFNIYNIGVFSLGQSYNHVAHEIPTLCQQLVDVDVSSVVRFPEDPSARTKVWSCSEQTADCFFIWKHRIPAKETHEWFQHHCYGRSKQPCIDAAKFLRK